MTDFRRSHVTTLVERLSEPPERLIAIFGPRQTGKTTAARQALSSMSQEYRYEAVDEPESLAAPGPPTPVDDDSAIPSSTRDARWLTGVWEHSRRSAWSRLGFVLVLDEIQKIDQWSDTVKGLWDADRASGCPLHVVVLGSAPLPLQAGLNESLTGRFEPIRITHWSYLEMSEAFGYDLEQYIYFGGYPGAAIYTHDSERWRAYVRGALIEPSIERDVLSMTRVDKPALLKRVFDIAALYSGQVLSYNKMLGQLQDAGNTTTLTRYLELLTQVGLVTGLSKHTERLVSAKASTPKLNVLNTALMSVASGYSFDDSRADRSYWGRLVESAVGAHLISTASPSTVVKYWRDGPHEVDFVLCRGPHTVGIEVKSGKARAARSGLFEFKRRFQPRTTVLVGETGVPLHEFLSLPADYWFGSPSPSSKHDERRRSEELSAQQRTDELSAQRREEERQRREDWAKHIRSHEVELRENRFPLEDLSTLAKASLGLFGELGQEESPSRRISDFIGVDQRLVDAVMAALRGAMWRDDAPDVDSTISLRSESEQSWLAYPVLASLELLHGDDPTHLDRLDDVQKRKALAIHYCTPLGYNVRSPWYDRWLQQYPDLVLDVLSRCAVAAVRAGEWFVPGLSDLDSVTGHDDLVHEVRLRLLKAYPTRGSSKQLPLLDGLLKRVLEHPDKTDLEALVKRKLALTSMSVAQRVRWLAVEALRSQGSHQQLKAYVGESEIRARHLAEFLRNHSEPPQKPR